MTNNGAKRYASPDTTSQRGPSPTPSPKKTKSNSGTPKKASGGAGIWTPEKFGILSEEVLAVAMEHMDKDKVAAKLGVTKSQLTDQLKPNRSNFRKKFLEWAKGTSKE